MTPLPIALFALPIYSPQADLITLADSTPIALGSDELQRTVATDLTHDLVPDLVVLNDGVPTLIYNPASYMGTYEVPATGSDILGVSRAAGGANDGLLLTSERGLELWTLHPTAFIFESLLLADMNYANLIDMQIADVDGSGSDDLVALNATRSMLHVAYDFLGANPIWVTLGPLGTVGDFTVLDWNGSGGLEVALVNGTGLTLATLTTGSLVLHDSTVPSTDLLGTLKEAGTTDRLVRVTNGGNTIHTATVAGPDTSVLLGSPGVSAIASGDFDNDGLEDLACSITATGALWILTNQAPAAQIFDTGTATSTIVELGHTTPVPLNAAVPAIADMDLDGDLDIAVEIPTTQNARLFHNSSFDPSAQIPVITDGQWDSPSSTLTIDVSRPPGVDSTWTHVEWTGWLQDGAGLPLHVFDEAEFHQIVPIGSTGSLSAFMASHAATYQLMSAHVLELRWVKLDPSGDIIAALPLVKGVFGAHSPLVDIYDDLYGGGINVDPQRSTIDYGASDGGPGVVPDVDDTPCFIDEPPPSKEEKTGP